MGQPVLPKRQPAVILISIFILSRFDLTTAACGTFNCQFTCTSDSSCVAAAYVCDGSSNCADSSDELGCTQPAAPTSSEPLQDNFFVVADSNARTVLQVDPGFTNSIQLIQYNSFSNPIAVAYDPSAKDIYWTEVDCYKTIYKYSVTTKTVSRIYTDVSMTAVFDGLTLDSARRKLYYADAGYGRVGELSFDGSSHRIIDSDSSAKPRAVVVDTINRILYWTDWRDVNPGIYRSSITNASKSAVVTGNFLWPNAMTIDFDARLMYWGDAGLHRVERSNLDGSGRTLLWSDSTSRYFAMALDSTFLYYTDWSSNYIKKIHRTTLALSTHTSIFFQRANGIILVTNSTASTTSSSGSSTSVSRSSSLTSSSSSSSSSSSTTSANPQQSTTPTVNVFTDTNLTPRYPASSTGSNSLPSNSPTASSVEGNSSTITIAVAVSVIVGVVIIVVVVAVVVGLVLCKRREISTSHPAMPTQTPVQTGVSSSHYDEINPHPLDYGDAYIHPNFDNTNGQPPIVLKPGDDLSTTSANVYLHGTYQRPVRDPPPTYEALDPRSRLS